MKIILLLISLLTSGAAQADILGIIPNKMGGGIYLSDEQCPGQQTRVVWSTKRGGGNVIYGCWFYYQATSEVFIIWNDGQTYNYPASAVIVKPAMDSGKAF